MSDYRLQIVFEDGSKARFHPGSKSEEGNLIAACTDRIVSKGVGFMRTEAQVRSAIDSGLREVFGELKRNVKP